MASLAGTERMQNPPMGGPDGDANVKPKARYRLTQNEGTGTCQTQCAVSEIKTASQGGHPPLLLRDRSPQVHQVDRYADWRPPL